MDAQEKPQYVWHRSDRDDWVHATVYFRIGLDRFGDGGSIVTGESESKPNSYFINPDNTASFNPQELFRKEPMGDIYEESADWRD
jgi:hypothetical protein